MNKVLGIDVSFNQGKMDWHKARMAGAEFCGIRCTDGDRELDPQFLTNWRDAKSEGFQRLAYHVFQPHRSTIGQADWFLNHWPWEDDPGELGPWIDCERNKTKLGIAAACNRLQNFLLYIEKRIIVRPTIYTCAGLWNSIFGSPNFSRWYRFAIANYTTAPYPILPTCVWPDMVDYWQWSADKNGRGHEFGAESDDIDLDWRFVP